MKTVRINGSKAVFTRLAHGWMVEFHRRIPDLPHLTNQRIWCVLYGPLAALRSTVHRLSA